MYAKRVALMALISIHTDLNFIVNFNKSFYDRLYPRKEKFNSVNLNWKIFKVAVNVIILYFNIF